MGQLKCKVDDMEMEIKTLKQRIFVLEKEKKEMQVTIKSLKMKSINIYDFDKWDGNDVLNWILSIENGVLVEYEHALQKEIFDAEIKGINLIDLNTHDIKNLGV